MKAGVTDSLFSEVVFCQLPSVLRQATLMVWDEWFTTPVLSAAFLEGIFVAENLTTPSGLPGYPGRMTPPWKGGETLWFIYTLNSN